MGTPRPDRIVFVVPTLSRHGAETQLFHIATGLRSRGFDIHVVAMLSSDYFGAVLESRGIPVTCLEISRTTNWLRILVRFLRHMRDLQPAALVGFNYPGILLARAAGALARVPVVISSVHTVNQGTGLRRRALTWTDSFGTVTTAVSGAVARSLVDSGVAPGRVRVIPNGIDIGAIGPHLRSERRALRTSLGIGEHEFLWLAAGRLDPAKDYPNLLAAMALLAAGPTDVRLVIAGDGPLSDMLRARASVFGLDRIVSFVGVRQDVPSCMAAADATVLSSAWEGLPLVVIESLAVGTPVVSTDVGSVRDIIQDGQSGFVVAAAGSQGAGRGNVVADGAFGAGAAQDGRPGPGARGAPVLSRTGHHAVGRSARRAPGRLATTACRCADASGLSDSGTERAVKRLLDFVVGGLVLVTVSPLLLIIAVLVRTQLGSPVLFVQTRPGLRGRPFRIVKFRTMRDERGPDGRPLPDAARLTRFGAFLRSSSLDELPELWNVVERGDEPGRAASAADAVPGSLHAGAGAPARCAAGHYRPGPGQAAGTRSRGTRSSRSTSSTSSASRSPRHRDPGADHLAGRSAPRRPPPRTRHDARVHRFEPFHEDHDCRRRRAWSRWWRISSAPRRMPASRSNALAGSTTASRRPCRQRVLGRNQRTLAICRTTPWSWRSATTRPARSVSQPSAARGESAWRSPEHPQSDRGRRR